MKSYKHLWEQLLTKETVENAYKSFKKGRSNNFLVKTYKIDPQIIIDKFINLIENFPVFQHNQKDIYDGIERKRRHIIIPPDDEQFVHHMVISVLKPILQKPMYVHSYGSIPKKGCYRGKQQIEHWIETDCENTQFFLKMDIQKYFENIDHAILINKLARIIKDEKFMNLMKQFIEITLDDGSVLKKGLPLGFYTSQWLANFYLTDMDHYIKEQLHAVYYIRYMDDLIIFAKDRNILLELQQQISQYCKTELNLKIKPNWRIVELGALDGQDLDFMGYRFYKNRTTLRRKSLYHASSKARRISKKGRANIYEARQMLSHLGRMKKCDVYNSYLQWIKPYINIEQLRKIVSYHDRRNNLCGTNPNQ